MRRVDSEGVSQSSRDHKRSETRSGPAQKNHHLRRLALERLEDRTLLATAAAATKTLLSTLPTPITVGQSFVGSGITSNAANSSSPSVAIDPVDPNKLIAAWTTYDPAHKLDGNSGQVTTYVQGAYSLDGGTTWTELPGDMTVDVQTDFSVAPVTSGQQPDFPQTTNPTVAFGRDQTAYLLTDTFSGTGGVLDLQKWDYSNATTNAAPVPGAFTAPAYDSLSNSFAGAGNTVNPIYRWQGSGQNDGAISPTLAVDNNVGAFPAIGVPTQTDPYAGNVYVAWQTNDAPLKGATTANYNPFTIKLMASSDNGQNFTYQAYLNNHGLGNAYDLPKIAISQGSPSVPGGHVTIVYDNAGVGTTVAPYFDVVQTQSSDTGGSDQHADSGTNIPISLGSNPISIPVSINNANFTTLQNLTVTLSLSYPNLGDTSATLTSPGPNPTTVTLWNNATNAAGNATNSQGTLTGANLGAATLGPNSGLYIGTTLDSTAYRSLSVDGAAPYTGHFRPFGDLRTFQGLSAAALSGTWTLNITQYRTETITAPTPSPYLTGASLDFTSGLSDVTGGTQNFVTTSFLNSSTARPYVDGIQGVPVLPNPSIASDNTLGSNSPHQGRLYIALTDDNFNNITGAYTSATFIELWSSDDGGTSWNYDGIVNDDNGLKDGYSTGGYAQPGSILNGTNPPLASTSNPGVVFFGNPEANVRPKIEPQVAVDPVTGSVVVSFLDTRNDASAVRVANYIAVSTDGGGSFAPETYANPTTSIYSSPVIDAITGKPVNLGPVPDNESSGNNNRENTFGFGQSQGLAVLNGHIIPVWSSNQNTGSVILNNKSTLNIESAVITFAAGPRVIASTQGPVGEPGDTVNTARAADGSPIANTIVFTFDRAVDPASFPADGATIGNSPLQVFYNNPSGTAAPVPLRVLSVTPDLTNTVYTVTFDPAGNTVGTYSYTLNPLVKGLIPYEAVLSTDVAQQIPLIDSAVNLGQAQFSSTGHPGVLLTAATLAAKVDIYQKGTSTGSPTDLVIYLVTADNTSYTLYSASTQGRPANVGFNVSRTIAIPAIPPELLDQAYTIQVVDNVPGEKVFLYNNVNPNDFNFQVKLNNQTFSTVSGNYLDQNANGTPGEMPGDNYSVPNTRDSLPLIVPGPHVASTSVLGVNGTASTGSDNLVNNDNANSVTVTFDRNMQVSTFTPSQILSVVGPTGRIDGPQVFPSTGTSKTYAYPGSFQFIPKGGTPLNSTLLISNTGLNVSSLTVQVNITDPNNASLALSLVAPDGTAIPLVAAAAATGANLTNTTFSDTPTANGQSSTLANGVAPYSLTYTPASPLAGLTGKVLDGIWTLRVTDSTASPSVQGRLNSWSLGVTPQVPKGAGTQLNSSLVIPTYSDNSFLISHLSVQLNISSTLDSDLQINLISPKQTNGSQITVPLVMSLGANGTNANFTNTIFDDTATIPIAQGTAPYNLTYRPSSPLAALNGLSINGTWTLQIINPNADASNTTLNSWALIATPQLTVKAVNPVGNSAKTFTIGFPTQTLSGTYAVTLSPNILSVAANPANPSMGTPLDTNLNAGVYELRGTAIGATSTVVYPATAVPVTIPYAKLSPIGPVTNGVLTSQISVPDNFAIQGDVGTLAGLTVSLNISYYYDPDLTATLTAPDGKTVTLFMNVGKGGNTANFTNTTLSDTTTPLAPITAAGAPFFGTFNPQSPLSAFATDLSNNQAFSKGLWTLTITNIGQDPGPGTDALHPPSLLSWSMAFQKPQTNTGLGEPVADQKTVTFRLFNLAPTNPLANDTWTAVGPAGTTNVGNTINGNPGGVNLGGAVSVVTLDPSDPSGNTAYVGASSGGVWKTTDFLTTSPGGPTYVPLTDFGSNYSINIGGIAVFGRNNDPTQSIVFAGTGDGQATTANNGNASQGVGILRSTNGGASFTLLDSSSNVDASGNPLPINSPQRDHIFVGSTTYKIVVDPTPLPGGGQIVYAALGGKNGGLYRTLDGGDHWALLRAGTATDVLLDPVSGSASTGNLDILYAAFQGVGVFISSNRGQLLTEMFGNVGADNLIQNSVFAPAVPLKVNDANTPNGNFGRIILAKPALTDSAAQNILYQDWLYASVENTNGTFNGLYVTKDRGENWTKASIASDPSLTATVPLTQTEALPTNDNTQTNQYDVTAGKTIQTHNGNSAFSMTVDPLNPNIVYLGGTQDYQTSGLIRLDLTGLYDAHAYVPFANDQNDGGKLTLDSTGRVDLTSLTAYGLPFYQGTNPGDLSQQTGDYYVNLRHDPTNPFNTSSTLFVYNSSNFINNGAGVVWQPIDQIYGDSLNGSSNVHQLLSIVDPLTGLTRLIVSDDQGVFTGLYNPDGTLNTSGIGTSATVTGSRNGNLQDEQLYYSAAQPSALAAQTAGALFYGSGIGLTNVQSAANLLSTGNLTWTVQGTSYGDLQAVLATNDRSGTGIATDQTGGVSATSPNGNPAVYEFDIPLLGGDSTNFFRVNTNGQTTGLVLANYQTEFPGTGVQYNGVIQLGNFTVNPINGSQALISSNLGNLYETTNKGIQWLQIGSGSGSFDGTYAPALAYGAPDPGAPNGVGNLNNFVYAGTVGGHIYVTQNGGGPWTSISAGLDGSSVVQIYTNPNRGSHEAYAVTLKGVYYMANSTAANAAWVNITGNLTQIQHNAFNNPALAESALLNYANGQNGGFRAVLADYRYSIPTSTPLQAITATGPVAGPSTVASVTSAITVGGNASTSVLDASGAGNAGSVTAAIVLTNTAAGALPYTISIVAPDGETTILGKGSVAGGSLAKPTTLNVPITAASFSVTSSTLPVNGTYSLVVTNPGGVSVTISSWSLLLNAQAITTNPVIYVAGYGGVFRSLDNGQSWTSFPNTSFDSAPVDGGYLPNVDVTSLTLNLGAINPATGHPSQVIGDPEVLLASTLGRGDFAIRLAPDVFPTTIHFDATLPSPGGSDSGTSNSDRITNVLHPYIDGSSEISNFGNNVTITLTDAANGTVLGTGTTDQFGNFSVQITNTTDSTFFTSSTNLNDKVVGIQATDSSGAKGNVTFFRYTLITALPGTPSTPDLEATYDTGRSSTDNITDIVVPAPTPGVTPVFVPPIYDVATIAPPPGLPTSETVELFRSTSPNGPFVLVTTSAATGGTVMISDPSLQALAQAASANGGLNTNYYYQADEIDVAGNVSARSGVLQVNLITTTPPALPAPTLDPSTNSGLIPSQNITNFVNPIFDATNLLPNNQLQLYRSIKGATPNLVGTAPVGSTQVMDQAGAHTDGVYLYYVVQVDIAGNVSNFSTPVTVTVTTTTPPAPTISLIMSDDSGLPLHPNVTNVRTPHFSGLAPYNAGNNFPLNILIVTNGNNAAGQVVASTFPSANGTYLAQVISALPDGTYSFVARSTNLAGSYSYSSPLMVTIKGVGPQVVPTLSILPADDTGIKGDGVTANHSPHFTGKADPGDTVTLFAIINGQIAGPFATATASTINGTFTFALPFNLTNGTTQLVAQATDIANNKGPFSSPFSVRIISVAGDYLGIGAAQLSIFNPYNEQYVVQGVGYLTADTTPGRDVPVQYDLNGDGITDTVAYRFNTAEYYGRSSNGSPIDSAYGPGGSGLPVSGTFGATGTFIFGSYNPNNGIWYLSLPQSGGQQVTFGIPGLDVPVPAAYDGGGVSEIAVFRPSSSVAADQDSFTVVTGVTNNSVTSAYRVSFSNPAVTRLGFTYKPGDIAAPGDYDGIGRDEFAVYRPSTGQFFILNTPNVANPATWTLRTVSLNLPGGPNINDVPASQDYDGNGKIDPTVFRPSNSTFYVIHSSTGVQSNIQFGTPGVVIASAGPILYRLTALKGIYATTGGYGGKTSNNVVTAKSVPIGGGVTSESIVSASNSSTSSSGNQVLIALASPMVLTTPSATSTPVSTSPSTASALKNLVIVGASTPRTFIPIVTASKPTSAVEVHHVKAAKAKKPAKALVVDSRSHAAESTHPVHSTKTPAATAKLHPAVALMAIQKVVAAKKGRHQG